MKEANKSISKYMSREQGRSVSSSQKVQIARWDKITAQIDTMRSQKDVLLKCGLVKEAKALQERINEAEVDRIQLEDTINDERRIMCAQICIAFAACDIATTAADDFDEVMRKYGTSRADAVNSFSQAIREQASSFNKIVQVIDEAEHTALSLFYADMAEEITEAALAVAREIVAKYMNTEKGRRYL